MKLFFFIETRVVYFCTFIQGKTKTDFHFLLFTLILFATLHTTLHSPLSNTDSNGVQVYQLYKYHCSKVRAYTNFLLCNINSSYVTWSHSGIAQEEDLLPSSSPSLNTLFITRLFCYSYLLSSQWSEFSVQIHGDRFDWIYWISTVVFSSS